MKALAIGLIGVPLAVAAAPDGRALCPDSSGPVQAVEGYLTAMREQRYTDAYDFVSTAMTDGRPRTEWSALQDEFMRRGGVVIDGLEPRSAVNLEADAECVSTAVVPNILRSRDRFNEHGVIEFELYTVVRDGTQWRVESQETLYDDPVIQSWFPDIEIVEVSLSEAAPR